MFSKDMAAVIYNHPSLAFHSYNWLKCSRLSPTTLPHTFTTLFRTFWLSTFKRWKLAALILPFNIGDVKSRAGWEDLRARVGLVRCLKLEVGLINLSIYKAHSLVHRDYSKVLPEYFSASQFVYIMVLFIIFLSTHAAPHLPLLRKPCI